MSKSLYTTIKETTAPTTATVGVVGQLYLDTSTKTLYQCVSVTTDEIAGTTTYEWQSVGDETLAKQIKLITGVIESGLFCNFNITVVK